MYKDLVKLLRCKDKNKDLLSPRDLKAKVIYAGQTSVFYGTPRTAQRELSTSLRHSRGLLDPGRPVEHFTDERGKSGRLGLYMNDGRLSH